MGLYDDLTCSGAWCMCSEGHSLAGANFQTRDLGCTMGGFTLGERLAGAAGRSNLPVERPFTGRIEIYTSCRQCPAFVDRATRNLLDAWVELAVELVADEVRSVTRISPSTAEWIAGMRDADGPMSWAEALDYQRR